MKRIFHLSMLVALTLFVFACGQSGKEKAVSSAEGSAQTRSELDILNERILADSTNPDLYNQRATYFATHNNVNNALSDINKAIQMD